MATKKFTVTYSDDSVTWRDAQGRLSRPDGPAVECADGYKVWYVDDKYHRLDGPAVVYADGGKEWWIDGVALTEEQFNARTMTPVSACAGREVEIDGVKYRLEPV